MIKHYDYLFVTHLPAFYKVNLYNELAKRCRVCVIFVAPASDIRTPDFTPKAFAFDYHFLNTLPFEQRRSLQSIWRLRQLLKKISYQKCVVGGWDLLEFWWLVFCSPFKKNGLALESSILESQVAGIPAWIKKTFLSRIYVAFFSGKPHQALLNKLHFSGQMRETGGVGIFHYQAKRLKSIPFQGKFLYVGRLATEKNLLQLIQAFAQMPQFSLTIIGQGPLAETLKQQKTSNVNLVGHVPNSALAEWYQQHDVFILPSLKEPWGLVVEEALYYGLPIIASSQVGCGANLVEEPGTGLLFNPHDVKDLQRAIYQMAAQYDRFVERAAAVNFKLRDQQQIQQYLEALS